jgi:hypothetical protein
VESLPACVDGARGLLDDPRAVEVLEQLDYPFERFDLPYRGMSAGLHALGLVPYFERAEVHRLFAAWAQLLPGAWLLFDAVTPANPHRQQAILFSGEKLVAYLSDNGLIAGLGRAWWRRSFLAAWLRGTPARRLRPAADD